MDEKNLKILAYEAREALIAREDIADEDAICYGVSKAMCLYEEGFRKALEMMRAGVDLTAISAEMTQPEPRRSRR